MKKLALKFLLAVVVVSLMGCAAATRMIDYGSMKTDVAMNESIFLTPTDAAKTVYVQIRNTSSNQGITDTFQSMILSGIQGKGYQIVQKPSQATYILQANIRYIGEWKEGMDWGGTLTGTGLGALTGLGLAGPSAKLGGGIAGGIIGAGLGLAADMLTRVKMAIIVVEFRVTERLTKEEDLTGQKTYRGETVAESKVTGALGTQMDAPTTKVVTKDTFSTKEGVKIYDAAVAARAAQVNLNIIEASQRLIAVAGNQIAGIF